MTIIAYARDVLAADSRAIHNAEEMGEASLLSASALIKLKVLADDRIAVAVCGPIPTRHDWLEMEQVLLHYCVFLEQLRPELHGVAFEDHHVGLPVFHQRFVMVMTHHSTYLLMREDGKTSSKANGLTEVDPEALIAYGSGANIAYVAFAAGMDAKQTAEFVIEQDSLTGGPILSVRRDQLKPFVKIEDVVAPTKAAKSKRTKK